MYGAVLSSPVEGGMPEAPLQTVPHLRGTVLSFSE